MRFETIDRFVPFLRAGDIESCERVVIAQLQSLPHSPFHIAIDLEISNDPAHAAAHFDQFFLTESQRFKVAAAYTEMNEFDVNPNIWFCDLFTYPVYYGHDDYEWLCTPSGDFKSYVIKGLEELQAVYASEQYSSTDAREVCTVLVEVKFQRFMQKATAEMKELRFPLLATVHDSDSIAEFGPKSM